MERERIEFPHFYGGYGRAARMRFYEPVDDEVGVAADRGGEMRVVLEREPEMADVARRVHGLAHRAQRRRFHEVLFGLSLYRLKELVQLRARHVAARHLQVIAHDAQEIREILDAVGVRRSMDTIQRREMRPAVFRKLGEVFRDRLVREQHEVLDEEIRRLALLERYRDRRAVFVELHFYFRSVELDGSFCLAPRADLFRKLKEEGKLIVHRAATRVEHFLRALIGKPLVRVNDRFAEPFGNDVRLGVEREYGGNREAILVGIERAEIIGEDLGEHRDGPINEVHARRAPPRFGIERASGPYKKRDIGDMHADLDGSVIELAH